MRKFIVGAVAAVVLGLGFVASDASAAWVTRTAYRWDPACGRYIAVAERVWVPDYAYYGGPVYGAHRPYYHHHEWHEHHEHHRH